MSVLIETTLGDFVVDLFVKERPKCCLNFVKLCKAKYYNFSMFHFIEENFIAQTGDPDGNGRGGESIFRQVYGDQARFFEREELPKLLHHKRGLISMVNNGEDMHGSQFFVTLQDGLDFLDGKHTVFGEIVEGFEIIDQLNTVICDEEHLPYREVRITHTIVLHDPFNDPKGIKFPRRSPSPNEDMLKSGRIGVDESIDDFEGHTAEEVRDMIEQKEATARAHILEMIGDLHYAEEAPPDNVLFVCKLNAVTTDEDLNVIFSRFGEITSCEVIRDKNSGDSLQYAFIEFANPDDCEKAYFKMDNVLIDDRRIHVDFSQSVAKNFQWKKQLQKQQQAERSLTKKKNEDQRRYDNRKFDRSSRRQDDNGRHVRGSDPRPRHSRGHSDVIRNRHPKSRSRSPSRRHDDRKKSGHSSEKREKDRRRGNQSPKRSRHHKTTKRRHSSSSS